jgi:DNA primase
MIDVASIRKSLSDPVSVCIRLGLDIVKRQPRGVMLRCPVHDDRTPSCSVRVGSDGTLAVHCFGCGFSGDVLHLVAAVECLNIERDFAAVTRRAAELANISMPERREHRWEHHEEPVCSVLAFDAIAFMLARSGRLDDQQNARDVTAYLDGRRLLAEARADGWFALPSQSWAQREWQKTLYDVADSRDDVAAEHRPKWTRPDLDACGLFQRDVFGWSSHRLCIPWRDREGRVQTLQRRCFDERANKYVFPRRREPHWPYGVERLRAGVPLVVVEGAVDVLARRALHRRHGLERDAIGVPGVSSWKDSWAGLGRDRVVYVALDADDAGEKAVMQIAGDLYSTGAERVLRARPLNAADWAEELRQAS